MTRIAPILRHGPTLAAAAALALTLAAGTGAAAPVPGYRESFPGTSVEGWQAGVAISNPGTGGVGGAGDGYLRMSLTSTLPSPFGAYGAIPPYTGDWVAAGITQIRLWLRDDTAQPDTLEIHVSLGNATNGNFWQYNPGFVPPHGAWGPFTVDLTSGSAFTQIIATGGGTFTQALQGVDRLHVRHDQAPFVQTPENLLVADVGLDEILLTNGTAGVGAPFGTAARQPVLLAPPAPNPSRGPVRLALRTFEPGAVTIQVVDVAGRVVRHGALPAGPVGERGWTWDGRDDRGLALAPGAYRVRVVGPSGGTSQPLVRVR